MLSAKTLERVSSSYRRGYEDGYFGRPDVGEKTDGPLERPFANHDYTAGHKAGANDARWSAKSRLAGEGEAGRAALAPARCELLAAVLKAIRQVIPYLTRGEWPPPDVELPLFRAVAACDVVCPLNGKPCTWYACTPDLCAALTPDEAGTNERHNRTLTPQAMGAR